MSPALVLERESVDSALASSVDSVLGSNEASSAVICNHCLKKSLGHFLHRTLSLISSVAVAVFMALQLMLGVVPSLMCGDSGTLGDGTTSGLNIHNCAKGGCVMR